MTKGKCERCGNRNKCLPYILGAKAILIKHPELKNKLPSYLPQEGLAFEKKDPGKKMKIEWVDKHEKSL